MPSMILCVMIDFEGRYIFWREKKTYASNTPCSQQPHFCPSCPAILNDILFSLTTFIYGELLTVCRYPVSVSLFVLEIFPISSHFRPTSDLVLIRTLIIPASSYCSFTHSYFIFISWHRLPFYFGTRISLNMLKLFYWQRKYVNNRNKKSLSPTYNTIGTENPDNGVGNKKKNV